MAACRCSGVNCRLRFGLAIWAIPRMRFSAARYSHGERCDQNIGHRRLLARLLFLVNRIRRSVAFQSLAIKTGPMPNDDLDKLAHDLLDEAHQLILSMALTGRT